jgi:hypothetical protein
MGMNEWMNVFNYMGNLHDDDDDEIWFHTQVTTKWPHDGIESWVPAFYTQI